MSTLELFVNQLRRIQESITPLTTIKSEEESFLYGKLKKSFDAFRLEKYRQGETVFLIDFYKHKLEEIIDIEKAMKAYEKSSGNIIHSPHQLVIELKEQLNLLIQKESIPLSIDYNFNDTKIKKSNSIRQHSLLWNGSDDQLKLMFDFLTGKFIDQMSSFTDFKSLFANQLKPEMKPIKWVSSNRNLTILFSQLRSKGLIGGNEYHAVIENYKLFTNRNGVFFSRNTLNATKSQAEDGKKTKVIKDIEFFIETL